MPISNSVQFNRLSEMPVVWLRSRQKESDTVFLFVQRWHAGG